MFGGESGLERFPLSVFLRSAARNATAVNGGEQPVEQGSRRADMNACRLGLGASGVPAPSPQTLLLD